MNTFADDEAQTLKEARGFVDAIASSLPKRIRAADLTLKSKIPFKALTVRESLFHRVSALASAAVELFEANRVIPAITLTRAVVETVAVMFTFHEQLSRFLENKNTTDLDDFLMKITVGVRDDPDMPKAIKIVTMVDRVEKTFPGFRSLYGHLCEYTHPNWAGTFGAFAEENQKTLEVKLGPSTRPEAFSIGVSALSGALAILYHRYNDSAELMHRLNDSFEQGDSH